MGGGRGPGSLSLDRHRLRVFLSDAGLVASSDDLTGTIIPCPVVTGGGKR